MENSLNKWKPIQAGKLDCLNYCWHWPGFGSVFTSEGLGWFLATLRSVRQSLNYWQESKSLSLDSFSLSTRTGFPLPQQSQGVCVDEKESRDTPSPAGTRLAVVPVNNWTNHRCPAANLDCFQLHDPSISDQGWDNSFWKQRPFPHLLGEEEANKNTLIPSAFKM